MNPLPARSDRKHSRMRVACYAVVLFISQLFSSTAVQAQRDDSAALIGIIHAIEKGWEEGDGQPFRQYFLDFEGARYVESGGQNTSLTDLIEHHVVPESDAFDGFDVMFSNIETHIEGDFAWAVADFEYKAVVKSDKSRKQGRGYQTFLFRRVDGNWMVVHTHSSSRPVIDEPSHEHAAPHE
ncbi:MAG: nuclear transport factor 2 family protein [Gammaproteobacteria bacterium]|nr:nuclear transport factor 2 family protein [Gammaproteobacteria bacterium]MDH5620536.1 nuclear transport factor 2 family protein [Gammaproteobacteria bacterium]